MIIPLVSFKLNYEVIKVISLRDVINAKRSRRYKRRLIRNKYQVVINIRYGYRKIKLFAPRIKRSSHGSVFLGSFARAFSEKYAPGVASRSNLAQSESDSPMSLPSSSSSSPECNS